MRYTQAQVREAVGLPVETVRHWRKVLAPLRTKTGHAAVFTFGDLVALAIIRASVDDLGVPVSRFERHASKLFALCNAKPWTQLDSCLAIVRPDDVDLVDDTAPTTLHWARPCAVVPTEPIVAGLRKILLDGRDLEAQLQLRFPPAAVAAAP